MFARNLSLRIAATVLLSIQLTGITEACSVFFFGTGAASAFVARNYDWSCGAGLAVINKRGVEKRAVSPQAPANWKSKYGSVSFCQYGREFPCDGMNESGLMVSVLWLGDSQYARPDQRPSISTLQWVQYQLDTAASVADVVASDKKVRIVSLSGASVHYFVADKSGDCATIEMIGGKTEVHRGKQLAHRCLTNSTYASSKQAAAELKDFGGQDVAGQSGDSLERYCRAAIAAKPENWPAKLNADYGFKVLNDLRQNNYTKWQIVYDLSAGTMHFRTADANKNKQIRLADFDLQHITPVMVFDINSNDKAGNVHDQFVPYRPELNRELVTTAMNESGILRQHPHASVLQEMVISYPESYGHAEVEAAR